ncbi:MAG TPA: hypothetical protein VLE93_00610 [Candidatus Saccharimonadales bacterium]|nr:hypothetical protein [Candidatus Saccharimonadales bacterium]
MRESGPSAAEQWDERDRAIRDYSKLLESYRVSYQKIKNFRRLHVDPTDLEAQQQLVELEGDRHQIHLSLTEVGAKINRTGNDILVDIIRTDRTLEELGLPEFSILTSEDLSGGNWNVDAENLLPGETYKPRVQGYRFDSEEQVKEGEICLVYDIAPMEGDYWEPKPAFPADYQQKLGRAQALCQSFGGRLFEDQDGYHHDDTSVFITGVILPKESLAKTAAFIREHPQELRLGEEFYAPHQESEN